MSTLNKIPVRAMPCNNERGSGKTTAQMKAASQHAIFIWCNGDLYYPRCLAHKLGREDLEIHPASRLLSHKYFYFYGMPRNREIVIDHATLWPERVQGKRLHEMLASMYALSERFLITEYHDLSAQQLRL